MWLQCEQPFLSGERCVASRKTAAKETTFSATFPSNQRVLTDAGVLNKHESIPLFKYFSYDSKLHVDHSVDGLLLKKKRVL